MGKFETSEDRARAKSCVRRGGVPGKEWQSPCLGGGEGIERWKRKQCKDLCKIRTEQTIQAKKKIPSKVQRKEKKESERGLHSGLHAVQAKAACATPALKNRENTCEQLDPSCQEETSPRGW